MTQYNNNIGKKFDVVSMFAGCGGLDLGFIGGFDYKDETFENLPFKVLAAYDNDPKCIVTYKQNIGEDVFLSDLSRFDPSSMPKADVLIGGFPCQDFSSCGPLNGLNSDRGKLYRALIKYMKQFNPKIVVGENVVNLARMQKGEILATIVNDMEKAGYRIKVWRLNATDYGVPQTRTRIFLIGVRNDLSDFPIEPKKTHENNPRTIDWAIHDLETCTDETVINQSQYFKASTAKRGNGQGDERNKAGNPSYTIRANAKSRVQFHYLLDRRLTVRECARIQTFPDSFVFPHSATTNIMQIGNAVPPILAYHVAKSIASFLNEKN